MTYYMCFIETCVITCTIQKIQPIKNSYLELTFKGHPRSKVMRSTKRPYMKLWCFRPLLCTLLRLNWAKQTPGIMRWNEWRNLPPSGFELATQWSEDQHATAGLRRPPETIYDLLYVFHINFGYNMHHFWDISANRSLRPKFDLSDLQNDL